MSSMTKLFKWFVRTNTFFKITSRATHQLITYYPKERATWRTLQIDKYMWTPAMYLFPILDRSKLQGAWLGIALIQFLRHFQLILEISRITNYRRVVVFPYHWPQPQYGKIVKVHIKNKTNAWTNEKKSLFHFF